MTTQTSTPFMVFSVMYTIGIWFKRDAKKHSGVTLADCEHDTFVNIRIFEMHNYLQYDIKCSTFQCLRW